MAKEGGESMSLLRHVRIVALVLGIFAAPVITAGWNEPDSFRGIPWGASESVLREKDQWVRVCGDSFLEIFKLFGDRWCDSEFTLGSVNMRMT
jgi:hypothetical protein